MIDSLTNNTNIKKTVFRYDYLFLLMLIIHPSWIYIAKWWWLKKNRAYKIDWNGFGIQWPWKFAINLLGHRKTCNYNNVLICKPSKTSVSMLHDKETLEVLWINYWLHFHEIKIVLQVGRGYNGSRSNNIWSFNCSNILQSCQHFHHTQ